ncbi:MAG: iron-containing alcohol dehydrogenase [Micromonosporaceae bacterium]
MPVDTAFGEIGLLRLPRQVLFGAGQRRAVGAAVRVLTRSALICTDARLAQSDEFTDVLDSLREAGVSVEVYNDTEAELPTSSIEACLRWARGREFGAVIGFGGGSCVDMAKVMAMLLTYGGQIQDYYGENQVPGPVTPVVAVPTTAGTGSEATPVAVLTDPERALKVGVSSPQLIPQVAICDPELTRSCPAGLTAASGADALVHLVESYTAIERPATAQTAYQRVFIGKSGFTDSVALAGLRLVGKSLLAAYREPGDMTARHDMAKAALAGGIALGVAGTAAAHALQYPLGALTRTSHGVGVGVLLPYVMRHNFPARIREYAVIGHALRDHPASGAKPADVTAARTGVEAVDAIVAGLDLPPTLRDLGLKQEQVSEVATLGLQATRLVENNPRPLDLAAMLAITQAAYDGDRGFSEPT